MNTYDSPAPTPPQGRLGLPTSSQNPPGRPTAKGDDRRSRRGVAGSGCVPGCGDGGRLGAISGVRGDHVAIQEPSTNLRVRSSNLFGRVTKFIEIQAKTGRSVMTGPLAFSGFPPHAHRWAHFAADLPVRCVRRPPERSPRPEGPVRRAALLGLDLVEIVQVDPLDLDGPGAPHPDIEADHQAI